MKGLDNHYVLWYNILVQKDRKEGIKKKMEKKIYSEKTEYGERIVIDYGAYKTVVDVEDGDKSGTGDDRIYIAHERKDGDIVDLSRVCVNSQGYIIDRFWDNTVEDTATIWFNDIYENEDEDWEEE